jgi:pimeloyl-ACP methyl ester carboxylesterase
MISKKTGYMESFDGTPIYYEVRGDGPPLFLCYGIVCTTNHWINQIKYFSKNFQVIVFDYRGHHMSAIPTNRDNFSIDAFAQDVKYLADHLGVKKASYVGHSFGAQVLIRTYDMFPEIFHNLIFINGFATNPIKGMFGLDVATSMFNIAKQGFEQLPETISYLWKMAVTNPITMRVSAMLGGFNISLTSFKEIEIYTRGVAGIEMDVFLRAFEHMMNYDGTPVLERIEVPTLIIAGNKDNVTPLSFQRNMHNKIKGSELLIVPYGSHCTQLDMPDFVNLRMEKFLNQQNFILGSKKSAETKSQSFQHNPG